MNILWIILAEILLCITGIHYFLNKIYLNSKLLYIAIILLFPNSLNYQICQLVPELINIILIPVQKTQRAHSLHHAVYFPLILRNGVGPAHFYCSRRVFTGLSLELQDQQERGLSVRVLLRTLTPSAQQSEAVETQHKCKCQDPHRLLLLNVF